MEEFREYQLGLRAYLYEMVASCLYAEPSEDTLDRLLSQKDHLEDLLAHWHEPTLRQSVSRFLKAVETSDVDDLAIDYARLFLGASGRSICPSESTYLEDRLFGNRTAEVIRFYARCEFALDESFEEPADHIAVECYFMSLLARSCLAAWHDRNKEISSFREHVRLQLVFLKEHLSQWIERLAMDVQDFSVTNFFNALTALAVVIVKSDQDFLQALTETERFQDETELHPPAPAPLLVPEKRKEHA